MSDRIAWLAGTLGGLGVIYHFIVRRFVWPFVCAAWRLARGTEQLVEDYRATGGFTGLHAQGVVLATEVAVVKALAQQSHHELHPNNGGSIPDALDRIEGAVDGLGKQARRLEGYAEDSREATALLDRRATDLDEKLEAQGQRITEHRRRNEETAALLRQRLDDELAAKQSALDEQREANEGLRASVNELLSDGKGGS